MATVEPPRWENHLTLKRTTDTSKPLAIPAIFRGRTGMTSRVQMTRGLSRPRRHAQAAEMNQGVPQAVNQRKRPHTESRRCGELPLLTAVRSAGDAADGTIRDQAAPPGFLWRK